MGTKRFIKVHLDPAQYHADVMQNNPCYAGAPRPHGAHIDVDTISSLILLYPLERSLLPRIVRKHSEGLHFFLPVS